MATRVINISRTPLTNDETELLCLGLSFTPTPEPDIIDIERDLYEFTRKLRLIYHFRNDKSTDESLIRRISSFCPNRNANPELERICTSIETSHIVSRNSEDNIGRLRPALNSLTKKVQDNEIVIKPADKGSIIVVMAPQFYWDMCLRHLNTSCYEEVEHDPCNIVLHELELFAEKHKNKLTEKEREMLLHSSHKISQFYMLPKLHKSVQINNVVSAEGEEYIHIPDGVTDLEGRPIVSGPCFHTRDLSIMIHNILLPCLDCIDYILKDSYDFQNKLDPHCTEDTQFVTWDIKSLYTSIRHDLFYDAIEFWMEKLHDRIPLLNRFGRGFVMDALKIILEFNYFVINGKFWHQLMGTAMGTPAAVVGANLVVGYLEIKMFRLLPQLYPQDFVDFMVRSFFRFLDDLIHEWLDKFDIQPLHALLNSFKYIMDNIQALANYLDMTVSVVGDTLSFDIYHKPTNSFNYLKYTSCHPKHTKQNIALSLGRRIIKLCSSNNHQKNLDALKLNLIKCDHPISVIEDALLKLYSPSSKPKDQDLIIAMRTFNPKQTPNIRLLENCLDNLQYPEMRKAFNNKKTLCTTRQPKSLRKSLVKANFSLTPPPSRPIRQVGLIPCGNCKFCKLGYISSATEIVLRRGNQVFTWKYNRLFTCNSTKVLYVLVCHCGKYYVGKAKEVKSRLSKHISDVRHPENSKCKKCTNHLRNCSKMKEPFFKFYPFYYAEEPGLQHFMETRFRLRWKPELNSY